MKDAMKEMMPGEIGQHAFLLGAFAFFAALVLASGNLYTRQAIRDRQREDLIRSLSMVIPDRLHDNDLLEDIVTVRDRNGRSFRVYLARRGSEVTAVAFERVEHGYGRIHLVMGVAANGEVLGVRVLDHEETPGLGDKIEIAKSDWIRSFDGKSLDNLSEKQWHVKKDGGVFDQFSGATITPRAVVRAVHDGLLLFRRNRDFLLNGASGGREAGGVRRGRRNRGGQGQ